jgi:hypothetical protein
MGRKEVVPNDGKIMRSGNKKQWLPTELIVPGMPALFLRVNRLNSSEVDTISNTKKML